MPSIESRFAGRNDEALPQAAQGGVMAASIQIDISDVIDKSRITRFQMVIFTLCTLCLLVDGFDLQALGYVAPAVVQDFKIPNATLGPVFGAANVGLLIGTVLFSMLADTIGRRPVLIGTTVFFGVVTLFTAYATSVRDLLVLRFLAGIGLGSVIPNVTALVAEYSPRRTRITAVMILTTLGLNGGAMIGGFISAWLIPAFGWASVFYAGGIAPLVIAVLMFFWLPESMQFLALRHRKPEKIANWMKRIDPTAAAGVEYVVREENRRGVPVIHLFREGRMMMTILLWIISVMNLLILYFLSSWLPIVIRDAGYSIASAVLIATGLQIGGMIGAFGLASLIGRRGFVPVLTSTLALAGAAIALIGQPGLSFPLLTAAVFVAGMCVIGSQLGINALAAISYPTYLRSSGVGWSAGVGRVGAIVGPIIGGELMRFRWPTSQIFLVAAIPAVISTAAMFSMRWAINRDLRTDGRGAVVHEGVAGPSP
jgi:AAHS family 4-hydroxybenzoate transporter-like MFS transporter